MRGGHQRTTLCGRFLNRLPAADIARIFGTRNPLTSYPARYNIAPTDPVLTVRFNSEIKERSLDALRRCLVPLWAKDLKIGSTMIKRAWRGSGDDVGIPRRLQEPSMSHPRIWILCVAENRRHQAALRHHPRRRSALRVFRALGALARQESWCWSRMD
jgi:putative SOS response-associated peptidase YedK